jgi:hypothetical protein
MRFVYALNAVYFLGCIASAIRPYWYAEPQITWSDIPGLAHVANPEEGRELYRKFPWMFWLTIVLGWPVLMLCQSRRT